MKSAYQLQNVDQIEATLTVTMSIGEWRALMRQVPNIRPSWMVAQRIGDMIALAQRTFEAEHSGERG